VGGSFFGIRQNEVKVKEDENKRVVECVGQHVCFAAVAGLSLSSGFLEDY
jgi:hypothetical protein